MILSKFIDALRSFRDACRRSPLEQILARRFDALRRKRRAPSIDSPLIAVAALSDALYYAMLGEIVSGLRARRMVRVEQLETQTLRFGAGKSLRGFLRARLDFNSLTRRKWGALYGLFCDRVGYRATDWISPFRALSQWWRAWRLWRSLRDKDMLAGLTDRGIVIGDLVIDTYLRLRPSTVVRLNDLYLFAVIRHALRHVDLNFAYFHRVRPAALLTIYAVYVQHGIPARVAVACGIKVIAFGNLQEFCSVLTSDHLHQTRRVDNYVADFNALPDRAARLEAASAAFQHRVSGGGDAATAYMRSSAYAVKTTEVPDAHGAAIVFLHDFYDSVHIYRWNVFHDFWEWASATIETFQKSGHAYFIKPHPNQRAESNIEMAALRARYPQARFLSPDISNRQLADAGMSCAVTMFGSIAAEMAYMGVPSVSCGDNPHVGLDALHLARSKEEYRQLLENFPSFIRQPEKLKEQACIFYYMHNLNLDSADSELRDKFANTFFYLNALSAAGSPNAAEIDRFLDTFTAGPGFERFAQMISTDDSRTVQGSNVTKE